MKGEKAVVVYADLLFMENLLANCFILKLTGVLSGTSPKLWRLLLSGAFGALYAVCAVIFQESALLTSPVLKLAISVVMAALAYTPRTLTGFARRWGMMLLSAFLLAGGTYAVAVMLGEGAIAYGGFMVLSPGSALKAFMVAALACILLARPIGRVLSGKELREGSIVSVVLHLGNKTARFNALVDTGNSLTDPLTGYPVIVVEAESLKEILPQPIYESVASNNIEKVAQCLVPDSENGFSKRVHLIPYKSIGRENGMLTGFRPDNIRVCKGKNGGRDIKDVIIGVCGIKLSDSSKYTALLGPSMMAGSA